MTESEPIPPQLADFPPEVQNAYMRFKAVGDLDAEQSVVLAILKELAPKNIIGSNVLYDSLRLVQDLGFDSLAVAEAVFFIEDVFHVKIGNEDLVGLATVGELRAFVVAKLAAR